MKPPLWLGVHEAAHAVAKFALDELLPYPGPGMGFVTVRCDGDSLGRVMTQLRQKPYVPRNIIPAEFLPDSIRNAEFDVIGTLAGPVAEIKQRQGRWGLFLSVNSIIGAMLAIEDPQADSDDPHVARQSLDWIAPPDPAATLRDLWFRAVLLIHIEFPGIVAVARLLCREGYMEGEAFEAAWRDCRQSEALRQRRACGKIARDAEASWPGNVGQVKRAEWR